MATKNQVIEIIPQKTIWKGEKQAPVSVVLFGDYESDATSRANQAILQIFDLFPNKIRYNYRHFPLTQTIRKRRRLQKLLSALHRKANFGNCMRSFLRRKEVWVPLRLKNTQKKRALPTRNFWRRLSTQLIVGKCVPIF